MMKVSNGRPILSAMCEENRRLFLRQLQRNATMPRHLSTSMPSFPDLSTTGNFLDDVWRNEDSKLILLVVAGLPLFHFGLNEVLPF
jgi:hypothetical protein